MSTTDPRTGFVVRNSATDQEVRDAQAAALAAAQAEPEPIWGNVGQGAGRGMDPSAFTAENLSNHAFYQAHKAEILAAAARNELPGQSSHATNSLGL